MNRSIWLIAIAMGTVVSTMPVATGEEKPETWNLRHVDMSYLSLPDGTTRPVLSTDDWLARREEILSGMEAAMGPFPDRRTKLPLDPVELSVTEVEPGLVRKKISYQSDHGPRIHAHLFLPTGHDSQGNEPVLIRPAVLCLHQTNNVGKDEPAGLGGLDSLHYALELARRGFVTLAPDYPSFGEHKYDFTADYHIQNYASGSMKAIWDNIRAIDYLETIPTVDPARIGAIGHSLGGHNTLFTAVFDQRIKVAVTSCGFTRAHKYYGGDLTGWTSERYMPVIRTKFHCRADEIPFDFPEVLGAIAPRAVFVSAPVGDGNFDVSGVRDCIEAAGPVFAKHGVTGNLKAIYPDCAHDFPAAAREEAYAFIEAILGDDDDDE